MKLRGKARQLADPTTGKLEWSFWPQTQEEARREGLAKYFPMTVCSIHKEKSVFYTVTGEPACCANRNAVDAYNHAVVSLKEPASVTEAVQKGLDYYWSSMAIEYCGHPGKKTFAGACVFCKENKTKSPRQLAIKAGETWYMPAGDDPCSNGHLARRRTANGSCEECERGCKKPAESAGPQLWEAFPEMVISRTDAREAGMKRFRTGEPCHKGHRGWRYVSTCGCIDCKDGK